MAYTESTGNKEAAINVDVVAANVMNLSFLLAKAHGIEIISDGLFGGGEEPIVGGSKGQLFIGFVGHLDRLRKVEDDFNALHYRTGNDPRIPRYFDFIEDQGAGDKHMLFVDIAPLLDESEALQKIVTQKSLRSMFKQLAWGAGLAVAGSAVHAEAFLNPRIRTFFEAFAQIVGGTFAEIVGMTKVKSALRHVGMPRLSEQMSMTDDFLLYYGSVMHQTAQYYIGKGFQIERGETTGIGM